jgi:hypothetical protein
LLHFTLAGKKDASNPVLLVSLESSRGGGVHQQLDEIHSTGMLQILFFVSLESSGGGGVHRLGFMVFGLWCRSS